LTSTVDNCCQRAKVHRLVAQPRLFAKCQDHVALNILGTCVIFLRLLPSALSKYPKCESAPHYFSKGRAALLFNFSKCKQALIFYSGCKPALIFILLGMKQCPIFVSKQFHVSLLFFGLF
jgi:hypothetical protein